MLEALKKEMVLRKSELSEPVNTIYFGGGTPSILAEKELNELMELIHDSYAIGSQIEFTVECNPDDLSPDKLIQIRNVGVNRLSIGVQSFRDEELLFFNRGHNAKQAKQSILDAQNAGFSNITIDLIYGAPTLDQKAWESNLNQFEALNLPHLSAYTLTVEPKTAIHHSVSTNKITMPQDDLVIAQFNQLRQRTKDMGLVHYEVSNFGKEGYFSQHNSNYWKGVHYLGFGPSAHSFDGNSRRWNVANNMKYIAALNANGSYFEQEEIDVATAYNEYILTGLRTIWGIQKSEILERFGPKLKAHFDAELEKLLKTSYLQIENDKITLTPEGLTVADGIASDLFFT